MNGTVIICPRCLRSSPHPKDIEHGWCANCNDETRGRVVTIEGLMSVSDPRLVRAKALYRVELAAAEAVYAGATPMEVLRAALDGHGAGCDAATEAELAPLMVRLAGGL